MDETLDDIVDDWFIESLKIYKDLHVYQLEHPTRIIEWTSGKTVCVAGYRSSKNEILELRLPQKLFVDENKGLCAERDFKVIHGGFTDGPVHCLKHIPGTRCVVTNDGLSSRLQIWDIGGDDSDVIRRAGFIEPQTVVERGSKMAVGLTSVPSVLHGSQISDIQLTDLSSGKTLYALGADSTDILSSLQFTRDSAFLACAHNGDLYVGDTRTSSVPQPTPAVATDAAHWCMAVSPAEASSSDPACCRVTRLSSSGRVTVSDLRDMRRPVCQAQLGVQASNGSSHHFMQVTWAPALHSCVAVSGFNGVVQIYNTSTWSPELKEAQPLFEHHGHVFSGHPETSSVLITSHVWHPSRPRTVLSAATDGSVHVWDWVDKTAAS